MINQAGPVRAPLFARRAEPCETRRPPASARRLDRLQGGSSDAHHHPPPRREDHARRRRHDPGDGGQRLQRPHRHRRTQVRSRSTARRSGPPSRRRTQAAAAHGPDATSRPTPLPQRQPGPVGRTKEGSTTGCPCEFSNNIEAFNAHRQLDRHGRRSSRSPWSGSPPATGSTAPPTTRPASPSARSCAPRSAASRRPSATPRTASRSSRRPRASLAEVHSMLQRVRELAVQYKNGTLSTTDQAAIQAEVDQLAVRDRAHRHARRVQRHQAARTPTSSITFQVGANDAETITVVDDLAGRRSEHVAVALGALARARPTSPRSTPRSTHVSQQRAVFGAVQNRLEHTLQRLSSTRRTWSPPSRASATSTWPRRW